MTGLISFGDQGNYSCLYRATTPERYNSSLFESHYHNTYYLIGFRGNCRDIAGNINTRY